MIPSIFSTTLQQPQKRGAHIDVMPEHGPIFIMDNGASTIKSGFASDDQPQLIPNAKMKVKSERQRQYVGDQIENCKDCSGLYYILAHQRGFLINWDIQREVWEYLLTRKYSTLIPKETDLILTEPYFNFKTIQNNTDEVLFEEYGFNSVFRTNTGYLASINNMNQTSPDEKSSADNPNEINLACLVVDSGFSFTHIAPYVYCEKRGYLKLKQGVRRIDIGGKALTNHLKEIISYRQMNVMDETFVINQCKEDTCFVATDFKASLRECEKKKHNKIARDYILPDFTSVKRGYVRKPVWKASIRTDPNSTEPQFLRLANERFQVPEILFNPSDIGISQIGIVEAIVDSINSLPRKLHPFLYRNVVLIGGNASMPGYKERIENGLRAYCPSEFQLNVYLSDNPTTLSWFGGRALAQKHTQMFDQMVITKKQYDESGENRKLICVEAFDV